MSNPSMNPFEELSKIFVENQRNFEIKTSELKSRAKSLQDKLDNLCLQLEHDAFSTNLNSLINVEEESRLLLYVAKEVEFQREKITNSLVMLKESNKVKLNK